MKPDRAVRYDETTPLLKILGESAARSGLAANGVQSKLLHQFGLDHLRLTHRFQGRDFRLTDVGGQVIKDWIA